MNNLLQPITEFVSTLQPLLNFIEMLFVFAFHHPIVSVIIVLIALFLVTGLFQTIMEWSKNFWDNFFLYSGKSLQFILKSIWKLLLSIFRILKQKVVPNQNVKIFNTSKSISYERDSKTSNKNNLLY